MSDTNGKKWQETFYIEPDAPSPSLATAFGEGTGFWIMADGERPSSSANPGPYMRKAGWFETHAEAEQHLKDLQAKGEDVAFAPIIHPDDHRFVHPSRRDNEIHNSNVER